jgi:hypothetical protein
MKIVINSQKSVYYVKYKRENIQKFFIDLT